MTTNCIIVDDEPLARELLECYIAKIPGLRLAASCENALQAYSLLQEQAIDLMFMDIEMPLLKGNDFLSGLSKPPAVIVTTAYRDYALQGYEMDVVDYLLKPIVFERFFKAVEKFNRQRVNVPLRNRDSKPIDQIYVQSGARYIRLSLRDILFVESAKDYITIHLERAPDLIVKYNISAFAGLLDDRFLRVHRSYIVNTEQIASFSKSELWIGDVVIPVGDSFCESWKAYSARLVRD